MTASPDALTLVQRHEKMMGTRVGVHVAVPPVHEAGARDAMGACVAWLGEVERCLTRFTPDSELSRLNDHAGQWQPVSETLFAVMRAALDAARSTDGLFDPALLPLIEALGYDRDYSLIAHREARAAWRVVDGAQVMGRWREIVLDDSSRRIWLPAGTRIDLGGIAKGWAADEALERFFKPFDNVLVDVGADMRARGGPQPDQGWPIGVPNPRAADKDEMASYRAIITLGAGGLATSGATERWWYRAGERQHHLVDPRTGHPARLWIDAQDDGPDGVDAAGLIATATALAPTAVEAEVAAKVALLRGYPRALGLVESAWARRRETPDARDARVALVLILGSGEIACATHLRDFLATLGNEGKLWIQG